MGDIYNDEMLDGLEKASLAFISAEKIVKIPQTGNMKKGLAAAKLISTNFPSDKRAGLVKIVATLLNVDSVPMLMALSSSQDKANFRAGALNQYRAIIITPPNTTHHTYVENRPAFYNGSGHYCFQFKDTRERIEGNNPPSRHDVDHADNWRFATADEIKAEIARVKTLK